MPRPTGLLSLGLGLALGATAAFALRSALPRPAPDLASTTSTATAATRSAVSTVPLLLPPRLDAAEADAALAAYLALPPLPADAPPAEIVARLARLRALLTLLPDAHFEKLFATLAHRVGGAEARLRRVAFEAWTERDAPAAARWALAIVPGEAINAAARARYLDIAAQAWAETDFAAAYAWTSTVPDPELAAELAARLLSRLIATDPARALELARARGDAFFKDQRHHLFNAWAKSDPVAALTIFGAEFERNDFHQWGVRQALNQWLVRDPRAAFDWLVARDAALAENSGSEPSILRSLAWSLADQPESGRAMADLLATRLDLPDHATILRDFSHSWVRRDPAAALAWIKTLSDPERRTDLIQANLGYTGNSDAFFAFVRELPEGAVRTEKIAGYLANWAKSSPDAALAWLEANPSPELDAAASRVQSAILGNLARDNPSAALARWEALPPADRAAAAGPIASAWAVSDPAAAAAWLMPLLEKAAPHDAEHQRLTNSYAAAMSRLGRTDPEAVLRLAAGTTNEMLRLHAYFALANDHTFISDGVPVETTLPHPRRADLLATIPDEKSRGQALGVLMGNWLRYDYDAARAWIENHDALSPEQSAALLTRADPASLSYY